LVPKPDKDGAGVGGIDTIFTRAPLGTNVGWNLRPGFRAPALCSLSGSFVPFAQTKAERWARGDSRKSLEERYKDHDGFVKAVRKAAKELVRERFLLEEDANAFIGAARRVTSCAGKSTRNTRVLKGMVVRGAKALTPGPFSDDGTHLLFSLRCSFHTARSFTRQFVSRKQEGP